ncbi:unnamed protein product [Leptidea sinapis]|uniref:Uncharacterized protein n=1 Tax=Leptidea sinapis TaxID=189913 RepID=A0A5E4QZ08_9NEOP|nr:unnamed protein product [Leptidea sinapis]
MLSYFLIINLFIVSLSRPAFSKTLDNLAGAVNSSSFNSLLRNTTKETKFTGVSEGGSIPVTLPKENHTMILNFDNELGKNKEKSVVARKGVKYDLKEDDTVKELTGLLHDTVISNKSDVAIIPPLNSSVVNNNVNVVKPHKPRVLSADVLENLGPDDDIDPIPKVQKLHQNSHPDLIMPIVITILVVPMFAVITYMAIKRGREAWQNRHYKRMDFLLDGMYND